MRVTMLGSAMPFGGAILGVLMVIRPDLNWKTVFWIGGIAPILVAVLMTFTLPESPAFIRRKSGSDADLPNRNNVAEALFGKRRIALTVLIWASSLFTALGLYMMINWLPSLLVDKGFAKPDAGKIVMLMTFGGAASGFAFGLLARQKARGWLYTGTWTGMVLSIVLMAFSGPSVALAALASFGIGFFMSGGQFLLYALSTELYPANIRGTGVGFAVGIGRLGAVVGPLLAGGLLMNNANVNLVILTVAPIVIIALVTALCLLVQKTKTAVLSSGFD